MGARENAALIRRGYAAFSAGDMATLTELFADDIVGTWSVAEGNREQSTAGMPSSRTSGMEPAPRET